MCTVIVSLRPGAAWPLHVAANRDERLDRPWTPPGRHWPVQPDAFGPRDDLVGGSWLTVNEAGVVGAVMNRSGSLGPAPGKRSRGDLPLLAAQFAHAADAARAISELDAGTFRSFNMVVADREEAFFLRGLGYGQPQIMRLEPGVHMIASGEPDEITTPRIARHLPRFRAIEPPDPQIGWSGWSALLADRSLPAGSELNIPPRSGFGTTNSSIIAVPAETDRLARWLFSGGAPDRVGFREVEFEPAVAIASGAPSAGQYAG
ncbi:hypothetical protein FHR90_001038 [Endobacter medicaginis]|uniref:NRDE family protein n=3 Tax=Endobacter medicaginis TaxID=1181271 RepID=A0A839UYL1_9PROT|nr:hypothetical protein [Endobacter medicaginis]MCX5476491.1 NRDE family protein [Endobacter medicaginis]